MVKKVRKETKNNWAILDKIARNHKLLLEKYNLTRVDIDILMALALCFNIKNKYMFPNQDILMERAGVDQPRVSKGLKHCNEVGLVDIFSTNINNGLYKRNKGNQYKFTDLFFTELGLSGFIEIEKIDDNASPQEIALMLKEYKYDPYGEYYDHRILEITVHAVKEYLDCYKLEIKKEHFRLKPAQFKTAFNTLYKFINDSEDQINEIVITQMIEQFFKSKIKTNYSFIHFCQKNILQNRFHEVSRYM